MKMLGDDNVVARCLWLVSAFILLGIGVGCVWWPASQRLSELRGQARTMYEEANQNVDTVRHAKDLLAARKRVVRDVASLSGQASSAAATASVLALLADESKRNGIEVRSVVPDANQTQQKNPNVEASLYSSDLALDVRGTFRSVLSLLSDLPRHDVLLEVRGITIAAAGAGVPGSPALNVTIHTTLYRLRNHLAMEGEHAPGSL